MAVVDPSFFYSAIVPGKGLGLFCRVELASNDIWWLHDLSDTRYVARVFEWDEYLRLCEREKREVEIWCYADSATRCLVVCASPFWCVNHAAKALANSGSDIHHNSIATRSIPAGEEISISYEYDAIISIVWKFSQFRELLNEDQLSDLDFLFQPASDCPLAVEFLERFSES